MKIEKNYELKPLTNYVLIEGIAENPFVKKVTDSGIILPNGLAHREGDGSGDYDAMEQVIRIGKVLEVGPEVKSLAIDDFVYFDVRSVRPVPFGKLGALHINENNILAYVRGQN